MKYFLKRCFSFIVIALIPIGILGAAYLYFDPFKIIYEYADYSAPVVAPNSDFISTHVFLRNEKKYHYNSFIFGSSRGLAFRPASWKNYLNAADQPYLFNASGESIYGIYTKMKLLDELNVSIDNALIIFCKDVTFGYARNHPGHLFIKHPATSGESNIAYHYEFFKAFLSPKFLYHFFHYKILGAYRPSMAGYIENRIMTYDTVTNEMRITDQEKEILQDSTAYYTSRKAMFYDRQGENTSTYIHISAEYLELLQKLKKLLVKHHTNYKIVISPLYDQTKFSTHDMDILNTMFKGHLYDFSGANELTENMGNYYETSHYRPSVGDSIMKCIYTTQQTNLK